MILAEKSLFIFDLIGLSNWSNWSAFTWKHFLEMGGNLTDLRLRSQD